MVPRGFIPVTLVILLPFLLNHNELHTSGVVFRQLLSGLPWNLHIHGSQGIHPNDTGDPMTSTLASTSDQSF